MSTYLSFKYAHSQELPAGHTSEVRTPDTLVEHFLTEYSEAGDRVIDVFGGYGTTLRVAEQLDRVPFGLEYDSDRVAHIREQISTPDHVKQGDVRELEPSWFPPCDCCFTSPPFMERTDTRNPFENYSGQSTYEDYLNDIETAFTNLNSVLVAGGTVIVSVANMKYGGRVTPLAWDVAQRVSNVFCFEGEIIITWEGEERSESRDGQFGYGYDHSYCHVFTKDSG